LVFPNVGSYFGGDLIAGILASGMTHHNELSILVDVGTNAEVVIGNSDWLVACAGAAGPALEGGVATMGMIAGPGVIDKVTIDPGTREFKTRTIDNQRPVGICGSGLITLVAKLLEAGVIDSGGKFNRNLNTPRIRQKDDIWEYVLVYKENSAIDRDITITEPDIDNLIRAKGAMYSAAMTLLDEIGLLVTDIERIILAGGFGSYINAGDREYFIQGQVRPDPDQDCYKNNNQYWFIVG